MADTPPGSSTKRGRAKNSTVFDIWKHQFVDATTVKNLQLTMCFRFIYTPFGLLIIIYTSFLTLFFHILIEQLETLESKKVDSIYLRIAKIFWQLLLAPWKILFAFVPPCNIAHGWIAFICSLLFISGVAFVVTRLTDLISCVTGTHIKAFKKSIKRFSILHLKTFEKTFFGLQV